MILITKKEAEQKSLAITSEGMHFKGQYLPNECFCILGKEVELLYLAFKYVYWVKYKDKEYFISEYLIKQF